jgi:23S rRNA (adenine2503-C2)-methyltransferase
VSVEAELTTVSLPVIEAAPPATAPDIRRSILDLTHEELTAWLSAAGLPAFRAKQIRRWLFRARIQSFADMRDLPQRLREQLASEFRFSSFERVGHQVALDRTEKLLLRLASWWNAY